MRVGCGKCGASVCRRCRKALTGYPTTVSLYDTDPVGPFCDPCARQLSHAEIRAMDTEDWRKRAGRPPEVTTAGYACAIALGTALFLLIAGLAWAAVKFS